jgi:AcrR family transcriptional regulator
MSVSAHASSGTRSRRWARTDATQQRILEAATEVFGQRGYTVATIGDVVAASGASIGSIYHHFGGKSELFEAIHDRMSADVELRIAEAEQNAASSSFEAQARAYLEAVWANRRTAMVLAADDVPPGFDRIRREGMRARFQNWLSVLDIDTSIDGTLLARILIAVLSESATLVMNCDDAAEAEPVIDAGIAYINRLTG